MEYCQSTLSSLLAKPFGSMSTQSRFAIGIGIARGLNYLHNELGSVPIIHRDIKPDNILVCRHHTFVRRLCFGIDSGRDALDH